MQITFLGATQTVTGSKYLLTVDSKKILIDCGLFQGYKELRLRNWDKFPVNPAEIDAVIITHAHIDHTGYLPLLVKNGFKGKIYTSPGTKVILFLTFLCLLILVRVLVSILQFTAGHTIAGGGRVSRLFQKLLSSKNSRHSEHYAASSTAAARQAV